MWRPSAGVPIGFPIDFLFLSVPIGIPTGFSVAEV